MDCDMLHKAIVGRWLDAFWGGQDLGAVDELASAGIVLQYATTAPLLGRAALKGFMSCLRRAFPDLRFERNGPLLADRGIVAYRWQCRGTHSGPAYDDFNIGPLRMASGSRIELAGHAAVRLDGGLIVEEAVWSARRQAQMRVVAGGLLV